MAKKTLTAWVRNTLLTADMTEQLLAAETRTTLLTRDEVIDGYARLVAYQLRSLGGLPAYVDTVTGRKISIHHDGARLFDPAVEHFGGRYDEPLPGYGGKTASELIAEDRLVPQVVRVPAYDAKIANNAVQAEFATA
ncbi:hypothetical protein QH494_03835 [Sphingomonas sp. AR_OL41]|uniref:hypothetical protein n=1 Tax=Sphingomonas sp. AR_OL41 TaxID=3042729 RepID=UPI0024805B3A|nr:hypothetical protein [Sphingomonas sp. AR_OL41]MDH7971301.1 hypothetical protein [Sphingomonas sp. AR_OL41]